MQPFGVYYPSIGYKTQLSDTQRYNTTTVRKFPTFSILLLLSMYLSKYIPSSVSVKHLRSETSYLPQPYSKQKTLQLYKVFKPQNPHPKTVKHYAVKHKTEKILGEKIGRKIFERD